MNTATLALSSCFLLLALSCGRPQPQAPAPAPAESTSPVTVPAPENGEPLVQPAEDSPAPGRATADMRESGLLVEDLVVGQGEEAASGRRVVVHYDGYLQNGSKFDSSVDRGSPFEIELGAGRVIKGWEEGVPGMRVGGRRRLTIPPALGYGAKGAAGKIPPNSILIFEIELLEVK